MKVLIQNSDGVFKEHELEVTCMDILGVATHYQQAVYNNEAEAWDLETTAYDKPKVKIEFTAKINTKLEITSVYTDGKNQFLVTQENEIRNLHGDLDRFNIPKSLACIYNVVAE